MQAADLQEPFRTHHAAHASRFWQKLGKKGHLWFQPLLAKTQVITIASQGKSAQMVNFVPSQEKPQFEIKARTILVNAQASSVVL